MAERKPLMRAIAAAAENGNGTSEEIGKFVPEPIPREPNLPPVAAKLAEARGALVEALRSQDPHRIRVQFASYDRTASFVDLIYRGIGTLYLDGGAAVQDAMHRANTQLLVHLSDVNHPLGKAHRQCARIEMAMTTVFHAVFVESKRPSTQIEGIVQSVCVVYTEMLSTLEAEGVEFATVVSISPPSQCRLAPFASAWIDHGFDSSEKFLAHPIGVIPQTMRNHLLRTCCPMLRADSATMECMWRYVCTTPLGRRLGMLARYSTRGDAAHLRGVYCGLLVEQMMMPAKNSLLSEDVHTQLIDNIERVPCATLGLDKKIPVVVMLNHVQMSFHDDVFVKLIHEHNYEYFSTWLTSVLDLFSPRTGVLTARECDAMATSGLAMPETLIMLAEVLYRLANALSVDPWTTLATQTRIVSRNTCQFVAMIAWLWRFRSTPTHARLLASMFFWYRYVVRGDHEPHEYWKWTLSRDLFLTDMKAFSVSSGWVSETQWMFDITGM